MDKSVMKCIYLLEGTLIVRGYRISFTIAIVLVVAYTNCMDKKNDEITIRAKLRNLKKSENPEGGGTGGGRWLRSVWNRCMGSGGGVGGSGCARRALGLQRIKAKKW